MIIHAIPEYINDKEYGAGNWKAVEGTCLALAEAEIQAKTVRFNDKMPEAILSELTPDTRHLLIEYSFWPNLQAEAKRQNPQLKVHVRTHNAEAYQYIHRYRRGRRDYIKLRLWRKFLELIARDSRSRSASDSLLGISVWDNQNYWRWLPGHASVLYLPYFSPWPFLRSNVEPRVWDQRQTVIVSMGGNFDPSGLLNVANFNTMAAKLPAISHDSWQFQLTWWSQWFERVPNVHANIEILRNCEEPWDLLCQVRALAVLTHLGFGFKTTIVDGLAAGCHVIVHPKLVNRLPPEVAQLCLVCDPSNDEHVARLAAALSSPPLPHDINRKLRDRAVAALRSTLKGG